MSDRKVADAIASGKVPEGITEAFLNESKDQPAIVAIVIVAVLTSCVVICRLVSRVFVVKRVGVDDGLALGSLVLFLPNGSCIARFANHYSTDLLHHIRCSLHSSDTIGFGSSLCVH